MKKEIFAIPVFEDKVDLEKIKIPENFPTHRAIGTETCKSSKGKTWSSSITFYLSNKSRNEF